MKKIILLVLVCICMLSVCACNSKTVENDISTDNSVASMADKELLPIEELGLTIVLPDTWNNRYALEKTDNGEYVVYNPNIRKAFSKESGLSNVGGMLFYIMKWDEQLTETQAKEGGEWNFAKNQYIMATEEGTYFLYYASDIQFTKETEKEYRQMEKEISQIQFVVDNTNSFVSLVDKELLLLSEDNMQIRLNADISTISKEPISKNEGQGDGFHWKEYSYGDIFVKALIGDSNSTNIIYVSTTSNKYKTPRDIKVGDTLQKLKEKYPEDLNKTLSDQICYEYAPQSIGFNRMYFYINNDTITKIVLENGIDG